jgi:transcriptional regulator with XRE-family HTH domain|nr:MAG TPA: helix-turn-helix domain protein [Caudoviricetes sp.]
MDENLARTAKALETARMRSGLSQQKLAARMGVNRGTIANWEQGLAAISLPMAMRWFACCGVSAARYMDACTHPGLLEHLEDGLSDMKKRQILIDAMMECSSYEIDALLYIWYGDHGSDHIGVLTEILANLHTPLKDRVTVCRMVSGNYEIAQATGTDPDPNGTVPKMEILYQAQDAGIEAAMKSNDSYTVNPNNITG